MSRLNRTLLPCMLISGLLPLLQSTANAQAPDGTGIVRITDITPGNVTPTGFGHHASPYTQGNVIAGDGMIIDGGPVYGYYGCPPGGGLRYTHKFHRMLDWLNPHGAYTHSPDHGFSPPVKRPIYRTGVGYRKNFPDAWTGAPSAAGAGLRVPQIYMPTDTTQLGYYYQQVPYWYPQPASVPPIPRPEEWHVNMQQTPLAGTHAAGVILGTAPTLPNAGPGVQPPAVTDHHLLTSIPSDPQQTSPQPQPALEQTAEAPVLLPIQQ